MKITAMVLSYNEEDYIRYCLESIKDIVDHVVIVDGESTDGTMEIIKELNHPMKTIIEDKKRDDYAYLRNEALNTIRKWNVDWVLVLDADEVFANSDGSPVTRAQLEEVIQKCEEKKAKAVDIFTRHFVYNYKFIDGRNNGQHFSMSRLYKMGPNVKYYGSLEVEGMSMHELPVWDIKSLNYPKLQFANPIIWHFGQCKGLERERRKYAQFLKILRAAHKEKFKDKMPSDDKYDVNEYCKKHELFQMRRPLIYYDGPLPKVLNLW